MSCDTSIASIAEEASDVLGDQDKDAEFSVWSQRTLEGYACSILGLLSAIHPESFTAKETVTLREGSTFDMSDYCDRLISIVEFIGPDGERITASSTGDIEFVRRVSGYPDPCGDTASTASSITYSIDSKNPNLITVYPPIAASGDIQAVLNCIDYTSIARDTTKPLPKQVWQFIPAIREWVLYSARITDNEVEQCGLAQAHFNSFISLVPAAAKMLRTSAKTVAGKQ